MMMRCWLFMVATAILMLYTATAVVDAAFVLVPTNNKVAFTSNKNNDNMFAKTKTNTRLFAIGVLARKAKEADVRKYCEAGVEDKVMDKYKLMKSVLLKDDDNDDNNNTKVGPLQQVLTKRKGTITVIAEYKRNLGKQHGYIDEVFDPEILSPSFREFGAAAIAVMADERIGGCSYDDIAAFVEEQRRAKQKVPGPIMVINNDLIVDEIQMAQSAAYGASAVVLTMSVIEKDDKVVELLKAAKALDLEVIVAVSTKEEAQTAIDLGARIISIIMGGTVTTEEEEGNSANDDDDDKGAAAIIQNLDIPNGAQVCTIANIVTRGNKEFEEIEEAWICRDKGFNCVWVSDALYKGGSSAVEHPGAVIKAMLSKSSVKWASPKARSGKGEGAREYLGDIMM